ncbi:hypothetical protein K1719_010183 [Acacia pycnantha]|nr:hypothetical protein K1719_010183 [Acacia pycnantha]
MPIVIPLSGINSFSPCSQSVQAKAKRVVKSIGYQAISQASVFQFRIRCAEKNPRLRQCSNHSIAVILEIVLSHNNNELTYQHVPIESRQYQAHIRGLNAYDRHKKFLNDYGIAAWPSTFVQEFHMQPIFWYPHSRKL